MKNFEPENDLEQAIKNVDSDEILRLVIAEKKQLTRPDALLAKELYDNVSRYAIAFLIGIGMTANAREAALEKLVEKCKISNDSWIVELKDMIELAMQPSPTMITKEENELIQAIHEQNSDKILHLLDQDIRLTRAEDLMTLSLAQLSVPIMLNVITRGICLHVLPRVYELWCNFEWSDDKTYDECCLVVNAICQYAWGNLKNDEDFQEFENFFSAADKMKVEPIPDLNKDFIKNQMAAYLKEEKGRYAVEREKMPEVANEIRQWHATLQEHPEKINQFDFELIDLAEKQGEWNSVRDIFNAIPALFETEAWDKLNFYKQIAFLKKYPALYSKFEFSKMETMEFTAFAESLNKDNAPLVSWEKLQDEFSWAYVLMGNPSLKAFCRCFERFGGIEWSFLSTKKELQNEYQEYLKRSGVSNKK